MSAPSPPCPPLWKDALRAFFTGGLICALGQLLKQGRLAFGLEEETAGPAVSVSLIFLGALLTGPGICDKLAKFSGSGTLVPITGFSNAVASPALEFKSEGLITGTMAKMLPIACSGDRFRRCSERGARAHAGAAGTREKKRGRFRGTSPLP